uniref:Uncharacterized protein n=1 Tax=Brassica oleracea var. oleracea TaxID=109376 RepID=A0A0D3CVZ3_BRAOL
VRYFYKWYRSTVERDRRRRRNSRGLKRIGGDDNIASKEASRLKPKSSRNLRKLMVKDCR